MSTPLAIKRFDILVYHTGCPHVTSFAVIGPSGNGTVPNISSSVTMFSIKYVLFWCDNLHHWDGMTWCAL